MAKSSNKELDLALVKETKRTISPFTLQLDHLVEINPQTGGFYFAFIEEGVIVYDYIPIINFVNGFRVKPGRFHLSKTVSERLTAKQYKRWYYCDRDYIYPLKKETYQRLVDRFMFIECVDDIHLDRTAILDLDIFQLRKKPLVENRKPKIPWNDHPVVEKLYEKTA